MKFLIVSGRTPCAPSTCAHCLTSIGISYLRDLPSKRLYCDYECYPGAAVPFAGTGIDGLSMGPAIFIAPFSVARIIRRRSCSGAAVPPVADAPPGRT